MKTIVISIINHSEIGGPRIVGLLGMCFPRPPGPRQIPVLKTFIEPLLRGVGDPGNKRCGEFGFQRALGITLWWLNYNDLTATEPWNHGCSSKGNHSKMTLFQVSEIL